MSKIKTLFIISLMVAASFAGSSVRGKVGIIQFAHEDYNSVTGTGTIYLKLENVTLGSVPGWLTLDMNNSHVRDYVFPALLNAKENDLYVRAYYDVEKVGGYPRINKLYFDHK